MDDNLLECIINKKRDKVINRPEVLNYLEQIKYLQWSGQQNQNQAKLQNEVQFGMEIKYQILVDIIVKIIKIIMKHYTLIMVSSKVLGMNQAKITQRIQQQLQQQIVSMNAENMQMINQSNMELYMKINQCGGVQNVKGLKIGKWIELGDEFRNKSQVFHSGEYINGSKVGLWDIIYKRMDKLDIIGGGSYIQKKEGSKKVVMEIELAHELQEKKQVIEQGEYKNGRKTAVKDFMIKNQKIKIQLKLENGQDDSLIIYNGQYINGKKVDKNRGGLKDSIRFGQWKDIREIFQIYLLKFDYITRDSEVTYNGEQQKERKVGRQWGGSYNQEQREDRIISSIKIGKQIDLSDNFSGNFIERSINNQKRIIIYDGEYQDGQKFCKQNILDSRWRKDPFEEIPKSELGSIKTGNGLSQVLTFVSNYII
ncbi:unnamed protein product [Paramecium sonneborni]|uniref:Uncharacterized protein n=1 Tax=Paramecium sonneborni TaxID=65129 RepID=A0A8S1M704_9CILI|nr:unnamed protein product [Paramecium sonneborni]